MTIKQYILVIIVSCIACTATAQYKKKLYPGTSGKSTLYFDEDSKLIPKHRFKKKVRSGAYFVIPHDSSPNYKQLIPRLVRGKLVLEQKNAILEVLQKTIKDSINSDKPIVILYYPGKDESNSGGNNTQKYLADKHKRLITNLEKIGDIKPMYIYKEYTGIEKYRGIMQWYKDPYNIIEQRFFRHHYPGGSFVVIGTDGTYISYKGEYGIERVWNAAEELSKP